MIKTLLEKIKGRPGCATCGGEGRYVFHGCTIFCTQCHGEEGVTLLWKAIDAYVAKTPKNDKKSHGRKPEAVWSSNADMLGFADAKIKYETKSMWSKVGIVNSKTL